MTLYERRGAGATAAVEHHPTSTKEFIKDDKHISCSFSIMKLIYRLLIRWLHLVHTQIEAIDDASRAAAHAQ